MKKRMPERFSAKLLFGMSILFLLIVLMSGCRVKYSFTGASISPDVKTFSVGYFQNLSTQVNPTLSSTLTEELKNKFITQTQLNIVNESGDLAFTGEIRGYRVAPVAIQSTELAAYNRLTISVRVKFVNAKDPAQSYDKTFSHFEDFPSNQQFPQVENELVRLIVEKLVEDIFNNAVANW